MINKKIILIINLIVLLAFTTGKIYSSEKILQEATPYQTKNEEVISDFKIEELFEGHYLPRTLQEYYSARHAWTKASNLLDTGKGEEALPSLMYAEKLYISDSLRILEEIAHGKYVRISPETQLIIKTKCAERWKNRQEYRDLYNSYNQMTRANIAELCKLRSQSKFGRFFSDLKDAFSPIRRKSSNFMPGISYENVAIPPEEQEKDNLSCVEELPLISLEEKKSL
ncbi:MAG: hypothetical protein K0M45_09385 [Candidatus Paracaedibacteraceae bacterium]|nr:hypothetical protein [Candidatus Paracaedibacteraceae bacterium]